MGSSLSRFRFLALVVAALLLVLPAQAQVLTGTITGSVSDPTDAVIPGASVVVKDLSTGREYTATTDSLGNFTVTNLAFGFYSVTIEAQGFAKYNSPHVQVNVAQIAKVLAKLELAKVGSQVMVTSEQTVVETESAEIKNSVIREQIMHLPLPTRNPLDLVRTMPGIVTPTSSGIADAFVHGLRGNSTNITQDGINVADNFVKTSSFFAISAPTVDTVGEFNVSIGGIGVDAGFGAAQVNIRTQRGGNDFHGSLFWFQRTNAFNSNTWFNNANGRDANGNPVSPRPFQLQNRIGASAGGPVYIPKVYDGRNKTWVFGAYEAFREPLSRSRTRTVLSADARNGLFSYVPTCTGSACPAGVLPGVRRQVNLLSLGTIGNSTVTPAINTAVMNFYNSLADLPNTDQGCGSGDTINIRCFQFNLPGKGKQNRYTIRADHQLFKNHAIEFVYNRATFDSNPDLLNGIEPQFPRSLGGSQTSIRETATWAFHSTFGSTRTNTARYGYQRAPVKFNLFNDFSSSGGFQITTPGVLSDPTLTSGNLPQGRNTPVRQLTDDFSWVKGRHTLHFGGEYRLVIANNFFWNTVVPRAFLGSNSSNPDGITASRFAGGISSGDLTRAQTVFDMVTGLLSSVQQGFNHTSATSGFVPGVPRIFNPIQQNMSGYFQDSWKIRSNLTLTFGARYEYQGVFDDRTGLILLPQDGLSALWGPSGLNNLFSPRATPVLNDVLLNFAGHNNGKPVYARDINNWAPFLGYAWDPWKNGKTSIRGGATVHFTQDGFTLFSNAVTGNAGLFTLAANNVPTGVFNASAVPTPPVPADVFPVSQRQNFINSTGQSMWVFQPNLATPYVIEWNLSVSRELWKRVTIEARYVGNHGVKQFRSFSINEQNLLNSPFSFGGASVANILTEFTNAQNNLAICTANRTACTGSATGSLRFDNRGLAGQVNTPIFNALFSGLSLGSGFTNSGFVTNLNQNAVGNMVDTLRRSNTYRANREANFPLNFFVANPFANNSILAGNAGWSFYHGGEVEVRRRFSSGLFFQANYTFSKVLTDARFLTSQNEFQNYQSITNSGLDKNRAAFDITHSFSANFIYPLPFGKGKRFLANANSFVDKFIGGWEFYGLTRWSSGAPLNITEPRLTNGSLETPTAVLRNMTASQLQQNMGVFEVPGSGVFWLNPNSGLITISGSGSTAVRCTAGQTSPCFDYPGVNQFGNLPYFGLNSPRFINQDFSISKKTAIPVISEKFNFEIRFEFFNAFNHPNFGSPQTNIDGGTFGQLTATVDTVRGGGVTSRIIQWAVRVNW